MKHYCWQFCSTFKSSGLENWEIGQVTQERWKIRPKKTVLQKGFIIRKSKIGLFFYFCLLIRFRDGRSVTFYWQVAKKGVLQGPFLKTAKLVVFFERTKDGEKKTKTDLFYFWDLTFSIAREVWHDLCLLIVKVYCIVHKYVSYYILILERFDYQI